MAGSHAGNGLFAKGVSAARVGDRSAVDCLGEGADERWTGGLDHHVLVIGEGWELLVGMVDFVQALAEFSVRLVAWPVDPRRGIDGSFQGLLLPGNNAL